MGTIIDYCRVLRAITAKEMKLPFYERNHVPHRPLTPHSSSLHRALYSEPKTRPPQHHHQSYSLPQPPFLPASASHYGLPFLTELQSPEEDSQDESPMERIPIRGKKAAPEPRHSHYPCVVVCFLPTAVNNGLFYTTVEAG